MASVRRLLAKYSISPAKRLGQHFLVDKVTMVSIVRTAEVSSQDTVVEVGPGLGEMTKLLASRAKKVIAIEIDEVMVQLLRDRLVGYENVMLIREDALRFDFLNESRKWGEKLKVVANLPYNISTQLVLRFVEAKEAFSTMALMFQREVAERIVALPGSKQYGILSILLQLHCDVSLRLRVSPSSFYPRPKVESAVVKVDFLQGPRVDITDEVLFRNVVKASFGHRRKTLRNALKNQLLLKGNGESIETSLRRAGIDPGRRGETLSLQEFADLSKALSQVMKSDDGSEPEDLHG